MGEPGRGSSILQRKAGSHGKAEHGVPRGGAELGTDDEGFCLSRFSVWASFRHFPDRATSRVMLSSLSMRKRQEPVRGESAGGGGEGRGLFLSQDSGPFSLS